MAMDTSFLETVREDLEYFGDQPFNVSDIKGFPYLEYQSNLSRYLEAARWFYGDALNDVEVEKSGDSTPLYPVRLNPLFSTCYKHASSLFGEFTDDGRPLVVPKLIAEGDSDITLTKVADQALAMTWFENLGRSLMFENGVLSQVYGGCVFGIRYWPYDSWRVIPLKIEQISPECFLGVPEFGDKFRLQEAWIVKPIKPEHALLYGYHAYENERNIFWVEHWTKDSFSMEINGHPISYQQDGVPIPASGRNPYGFVPYVYIPHVRTGNFYGQNIIDNLKGIVSELNLRVADYGDAVNADSHSYVAVRNIVGSIKAMKIAPGLEALDLGNNAGITGNEPEPDVKEVRKAQASPSMKDLVDLLILQYRQSAFLPAIADGEDEGSQRSALTLAMRMWPLVSHTNTERLFWTDGLNWLTSMMLRMLEMNGKAGITKEHIRLRIKQEWSPVLPKDRESYMTELVARMNANLGSPETLLAATGEIEDIEGEMVKIKDWLDYLAEMKKKSVPEQQPFGGGGAKPSSSQKK